MSAVPPPPPTGGRADTGTVPPAPGQTTGSGWTGEHTPPPASQHPPMGCPKCGAQLRPDQDWCLNCGAAVTTEIAGSRGWRVPVAIASVVLLIAAAALVFAFARLSSDADDVAAAPTPTATPSAAVSPTPSATPSTSAVPGTTAVPGTSPVPGASATPVVPGTTPVPGASTTPVPSATPSTTAIPGATPSTVPTLPGGGGSSSSFDSWPSGKTAFTVVLFSGGTRSAAESKARGYEAGGASVGILNSSNFSSLRRGFFVVFSGQYDSLSAAQRAAERLQSTQPGAYARQVKP